MKELISEDQADQIIFWLSVAVTLASVLYGILRAPKIQSSVRKRFWSHIVLSAATGPVIWAFWKVYNSIENHYGLDSLKALKINFFIAAGIGLAFFALFSLASRIFPEAKTKSL